MAELPESCLSYDLNTKLDASEVMQKKTQRSRMPFGSNVLWTDKAKI